TGPAFCDSPVWSAVVALTPAICAAAASTALTVTTPVPPMPGMRMATSLGTANAGAGRSPPSASLRLDFLALPGFTVMNDGQSPFRQLASTLQLAWSMTVLRPNSVSVECNDRQFDCTPQSPNASHTRSSINTSSQPGG